MNHHATVTSAAVPFDDARLDALMDDAGLDVLLVTSKHNVQYLLGGYRSFFFDYMDAIGLGRYLPVFVYVRGRPDLAAFFGNRLESFERDLGRFWTGTVDTTHWTAADTVRAAMAHIARCGAGRRIGVEETFLPKDAADALGDSGSLLHDATFVLERLRARKSADELRLLREASERVVQSMAATFAAARPGMTKRDLVRRMRSEETSRDLTFEYCLVTAGTALNRAPSDQVIAAGDILSLDSGANYQGYIGDLCRMGILGEPDNELRDLLAEIEAVQQAARRPVRAGARGGDIFAAAREALRAAPNVKEFVAHGMGLVSHEAPRLTATGPVPYPAYDEDRPLEEGMVLSIETTIPHPRRGFIKLEDTVAVTQTGWEGFGDLARGWNRAASG